MTPALAARSCAGGYWLRSRPPGAELAIAFAGAVAPEALKALRRVREDMPGAGLLARHLGRPAPRRLATASRAGRRGRRCWRRWRRTRRW